jgi:hypothetical protein
VGVKGVGAQTMYTHVSKCRHAKIKERRKKGRKGGKKEKERRKNDRKKGNGLISSTTNCIKHEGKALFVIDCR